MQHFASISPFLAFERARPLLLVAISALICFASSDLFAQNANTAGSNVSAEPQRQSKRVAPLRSSETAEGSRVTVTADVPLNDYAAYRNGNRFYVVVPGAAGSGGGGGVSGRGFDDAQVQRRGNDLVYSFRLKPGAKARVNQRFNRLDVEFAAPGGGETSDAANTNKSPSNVSTGENIPPRQTTANTSVSPTPLSGTATPTRTPSNSTARRTEEIAPNAQTPAAPLLFPNPADAPPVLNPTPAASGTPPPDQLAQAQTPPIITAPPSGATAVTTTPQTSTIGTVVARNWGWGVALLLALLFGLGLFYAARSSRTRATEPPPAPSSLAGDNLPSADELALPVAGTGAIIASATTMTAATQPVAPAVAPIVPATLAVSEGAATKESKPARQVVAPDDADLDDAEIVQAEVQKLLAGDEFNEKIIVSAGDYARSLVAADLLAALASRNTMSREAAQKAFVSYGYLDHAGRDLNNARTSAERATAARTLGHVKSHEATPYLVVALEDKSPEVRRAAVEALAEIRDPAAVPALEATRDREKRRDMPKQLINRAIAACAAGRPAPSTAQAVPQSQSADLLHRESSKVEPLEDATAHTSDSPTTPSASEVATEEAERAISAPPATIEPEDVITEAVTIESSAPTTESVSLAEVETAEHVAPTQAEEERFDFADTPVVVEAQEPALVVAEATPQTEVETLVTAQSPQLDEASSPGDEQTIEHQTVHVETDSGDHAVAQTTESSPATGVEAAPFDLVAASAPSVSSYEVNVPADDAAQQAPDDEWFDLSTQDGGAAAFEEHEVTLRQATPVEPFIKPVAEETTLVTQEASASDYEYGLAPTSAPFGVPVAEDSDITGLAPIPVTSAAEDATEAQAKTSEAFEVGTPHPVVSYIGIPENVRTRLLSADASTRARGVGELGALRTDEALQAIYTAFDDASPEVHVAAAQALHSTQEDRTNAFTHALREATPQRRRNIGSAIAASGLAAEAINNLAGESREKTYEAFSLLFLMAKAGEFGALLKAIEHNPNTEIRLAVVKLLALSGQPEVLPAFRRLAVRGSLPAEVRSAVMEAIYQIANQGAANAG